MTLMKLKALIVDDEYPARQELRYLLSKFNEVEVVGEATNADEALKLVKALEYAILFLDIDMPGKTGLELGALIQQKDNSPHVIFVTAYENFALKAFEVNAVDYILKPFDERRLRQAIDKVIKLEQHRQGTGGPVAIPREASSTGSRDQEIKIDRIPVEKKGKTVLIDEGQIYYAYTEQDYVFIKTAGERWITRFTLKDLENRLNEKHFFRSHRCYIVNLRRVKEIIPFFNGTYTLIVDDQEKSEIPVSRTQAKKLRKLFGI